MLTQKSAKSFKVGPLFCDFIMFSKDEKIWIITNYKKENGFSQLRRDFILRFKPVNKKMVPHVMAFSRIVNKFMKKGTVENCKQDCGRKSLPDDKISDVKKHFESNPKSSLRKASIELNMSVSSVHKTLKFKAYKPTLVQTLKPEHLQGRKAACGNFLKQKDGWQRKIIFSDEKWFTLSPHPNRKNDVIWSGENPSNICEVKQQGATKVMAWAGIVDGRVLPIYWFHENITAKSYLKMLENHVMPAIQGKKGLWFQQDGARVHTTDEVLDFLKSKFNGRVISNRLDFSWPAKSPDLNPLDYFFWGAAEAEVNEKKPKTICDLKKVVENYANQITRDTLHRVADNFMRRVKICYQEDGGHFEHLLKKSRL